MQYATRWIRSLIAVILATTLPAVTTLSQSGRGRPKVSQPSPSASKPVNVSVPAATVVTKQEQAGTTSRFSLRNGMTVVINEQHAAPIVAAVASFKAPASDEWGPNLAASLVERLIVNGNRKGEHALTRVRSLGALFETGRSQGCTNYSLVVSPDNLKDAFTILADSLQNPPLDDETLQMEIPRIVEEARLGHSRDDALAWSNAFTARTLEHDNEAAVSHLSSLDDPALYARARLVATAFGDPPANTSNADTLRSATVEQLIEFYRNRYRPENLVVSISGDISTFDTLILVQQLFGNFGEPASAVEKASKPAETRKPAGPVQKPGRAVSPVEAPEQPKTQSIESKPAPSGPQEKLRYAADRGDITQSIITVGFRVPGADSRDSAAVDVLTALLGQGRASRLSVSLIDGQKIANRIESGYVAQRKSGLLMIQLWAADSREGGSIDKAEAALFKILDSVRRETPGEAELARAKTVIEKQMLDATCTYLGRAAALARSEANGSGFRSALDYRTRVRAVSAADVQRIAATHLTIANTSVHEYEPFFAASRTFDSDTFARTVTSWAPGLSQPVENSSVRPAEPASSPAPVPQGADRSPEQRALMESVQPLPVKDFSTLNGPRAFVREDHSQANVTIAILFQGGRVTEEASTSGTTELMLRSILYGTPRRTYLQINEELEQLGADLKIVAEPDFFGFIVSVLSRNAERALKLVRDEIEEPAFRDEDVARARLGQIAFIREARDSSVSRSRELLLQGLFPGHPYSLPPHGREEVVTAVTGDKIREWHARVIKRQVPIAIIVGDTNGSALVSGQIAEGFRRRETDNATQVKVPNVATAAAKVEQRRSEHSIVAIGLAGPKANEDLAPLQVIEAAINSEAGRLFDARDKPVVILDGALDDEEMFVAGVIWGCALTSPENEQLARAALLAQFDGVTRGLTAVELTTARTLSATSRLALLQLQTQHALQYARAVFYRRQVAEVDEAGDHLMKVSSDDVKRVASTYFKTVAAATVVLRGAALHPQAPPAPKND